jgi:hypothetical protein
MSHRAGTASRHHAREETMTDTTNITIGSVTMTSPLTTAQLADMIGMTEQEMRHQGFDLALADSARWLIDNKVNLDDRNAVTVAFGPRPIAAPAGFFDAAVMLARSCTLTPSP